VREAAHAEDLLPSVRAWRKITARRHARRHMKSRRLRTALLFALSAALAAVVRSCGGGGERSINTTPTIPI
jgi:hypothetical protein